jgi:hypothetical protein
MFEAIKQFNRQQKRQMHCFRRMKEVASRRADNANDTES